MILKKSTCYISLFYVLKPCTKLHFIHLPWIYQTSCWLSYTWWYVNFPFSRITSFYKFLSLTRNCWEAIWNKCKWIYRIVSRLMLSYVYISNYSITKSRNFSELPSLTCCIFLNIWNSKYIAYFCTHFKIICMSIFIVNQFQYMKYHFVFLMVDYTTILLFLELYNHEPYKIVTCIVSSFGSVES